MVKAFLLECFMFIRAFPLHFLILTLSLTVLSFSASAQKPTAETFYDIGVETFNKMEYSEAIDAFRHAINLKPDYALAHKKLGDAYYSLHRYEEALESFRKATKVNSKYVDAYISLGSLASMFGEYDDAVRALKRAAKIEPDNAEVHFSLGNLYSEMEKFDQAAEAYKMAVKIKPRYAEAHYNLGVTYIKLDGEMIPKARQERNKLRKLDKELADALDEMLKGK